MDGRFLLALGVVCLVFLSCSDDGGSEPASDAGVTDSAGSPDSDESDSGPETPDAEPDAGPDTSTEPDGEPGTDAEPDTDTGAEPEPGAPLEDLLPADTRGVLDVDFGPLWSGDSAAAVTALLAGEGSEPALAELLGTIGDLTTSLASAELMTRALLVQPTDVAEGRFVIAQVTGQSIEEITGDPAPVADGTYGTPPTDLYVDDAGNQLALLTGGVLVAGSASAVRSVLDAVDDPASDEFELLPYLESLEPESAITFAVGLAALYDDSVVSDRSLRGAAVVTGSLDVDGGSISGTIAIHTPNAAKFVEAYNALNRHATDGESPLEARLELAGPVTGELGQVVLSVDAHPIAPTSEEAVLSRNTLKKLIVGMEAHDYAEDVFDPGNRAWLDLVVRSEEDDAAQPGSVFIRWEFQDQEAIEAFEANELPEGFSLAPCQFFETDAAEGEFFLALNLYGSGGGSIVNGARAEWDVFVHPPVGADPDAGTRPRFMVVDALAEALSADPVNLITDAEPLSHAFEGDSVVTRVAKFEEGEEVAVFDSSFPKPDPSTAAVARFTREMAIGNDYIYWGHGVYDRGLYNATTFNRDAYFVDPAEVTVVDASKWSQYLKPEIKDVVYYVNSLEYVVSPMANLDSEFLDIMPEWRSELMGFKNNGHQVGLMRKAVEQLFRGVGDALVEFRITNETPQVTYGFEITDSDGLSDVLGLPEGYTLAEVSIFEGESARATMILEVFEVEGSVEGLSVEWAVLVDDGSGRPARMVVRRHTREVTVDPTRLLQLPDAVTHELTDGVLSTELSAGAIEFRGTVQTGDSVERTLSLDWVESGDRRCSLNGICSQRFYDAETLDVPVHQPRSFTVDVLETPWNEFIASDSAVVFNRNNATPFALKRWQSLRVEVEELPFDGLPNPTHVVGGEGTLVGQATEVVNSDYLYSGDAVLEGNLLTFAIDQQIDNLLGVANIYTTGSFDVTSGLGTQTVVGCVGPALMCSGAVAGASAFYEAQNLDASDLDALTWQVDVLVDLGGTFGLGDSQSTFTATALE